MERRTASILVPTLLLMIVGCYPDVRITHTPVVAKSSQTVTFNAVLTSDGDAPPCTIQITVNGDVERTCTNMQEGDTCSYTGGPYTDREHGIVTYSARATSATGDGLGTFTYHFGVTDDAYNYAPMGFDCPWINARFTGPVDEKQDVVFHMAPDYGSFEAFVDDVGDKINTVYAQQAIIAERPHFDTFSFYVYRKTAAGSAGCGTVHADAERDMSWRDVDAVMHLSDFTDCTRGSHFSAEGGPTKAFLHESGHAVFDLGDEYDDDDCSTGGYYELADEPNIFDLRSGCRDEQTAKGRNPEACWEFTSCSGGWWGIHSLDVHTVMQMGNVGEPWGVEAEERLDWYYGHF
ncbi:MAG: hypothetical protein AB1640_23295 [bacterium]